MRWLLRANAPSFQFISLFLRALLAPELRLRIMRPVVISRSDQPLPRATFPQSTQVILSLTSQCVSSDCDVKMNWSTQKK